MTNCSKFCYLFLIFLTSLTLSCTKDNDVEIANEFLGSADLLESRNVSYIQTLSQTVSGISSEAQNQISSEIEVYKITYRTKGISGNKLDVSGLVMIPLGLAEVPLVLFQRDVACFVGRPICHNDLNSPSNNPDEIEQRTLKVLAGSGFVTMMPDLLGFGVNFTGEHPYEHGNSLATTSFDMIEATKELLAERGITANGQMFIGGYGEGGYGAMALHKYIEDSSDLEVTMSAPASGIYDKTLYTDNVFSGQMTGEPKLMASLNTYNSIYDLKYFEGAFNDHRSNRHAELVKDFLTDLNPDLIAAIEKNDRSDWSPKGAITMFQGTNGDEESLHMNGRATYEKLKSNGADVKLVEFDDVMFYRSLPNYMEEFYHLIVGFK